MVQVLYKGRKRLVHIGKNVIVVENFGLIVQLLTFT